jgi:hypothetical protein
LVDFIRSIFEFLATTYIGGCFWILFGIYMIYYTFNNPQKKQVFGPAREFK